VHGVGQLYSAVQLFKNSPNYRNITSFQIIHPRSRPYVTVCNEHQRRVRVDPSSTKLEDLPLSIVRNSVRNTSMAVPSKNNDKHAPFPNDILLI
jgi:hypothetical protein